jgi:nitroreductase
MDAETLLTTTRSVRRKLDLDRPVEDEVITDCLRVAMQAPAAGAVLPGIRWIVVRDPARKAALARHVREPGLASQARYGDRVAPATLASGRHLLDVLHRVPVLVLSCVAARPGDDPVYVNAFYGSVYPAIWSFQLALRARGLGTTITGYHLNGHEQDVAELLELPAEVTQVALLPVAYTTTAAFRPAARPAVEDITYYERWGQREIERPGDQPLPRPRG